MDKNRKKKICFITVFLTALVYVFVFRNNIFENYQRISDQVGSSTLYSEDQVMYVVTLKYMYQNGTLADSKNVFCYADGDDINLSINQIDGYTSNINSINEKIDDGFLERLESLDYVDVSKQEGYNIYRIYYTITYIPAPSQYKVVHYLQNTDGTYLKQYEEVFSNNVFIGDEVTADIVEYEGFNFNEEKSLYMTTVSKDGTTELSLYYDRNENYIYLDSNGGTYYEPVPTMYGKIIDLSSYVPQRAGYQFDKWECIDRLTGNVISEPATMPNNDIYYRVKWTAINTTYAFSYYIENADDNGYSNIGTSTVTAVSGTVLTSLNTTTIQTGFNKLKSDYAYFTYDEDKTKSECEYYNSNTGEYEIVINGDGSTVISVYYSRNTYNIAFDLVTRSNTLTMNNINYTTTTDKYTFNAKYQSNILLLWPTYDNFTSFASSSRPFTGWSGGSTSSSLYTSKRLTLTADLIADKTLNSTTTFTANYASATKSTLYYLFESFDQTDTTTSTTRRYYNGKYYESQPEYYQTAYANSTNWSAKDIDGVTNVGKENSGTTFYFYYDRNEMNITFYNVVEVETEKVVLYQQSVDSTIDSNGTRLMDIVPYKYPITTLGNGEYTFKGWYMDSACNIPVEWIDEDGNYKKITEDLTLYALWEPPEYNVYFNVNSGNWTDTSDEYTYENGLYTEKVKEGETLVAPTPPERVGYEFKGWYYTNEDGIELEYLFSESQHVYGDVELTAKWEPKSEGKYTVKYILAEYDNNGNLITDLNQYKNIEYLLPDKVVENIKYGTSVTEMAQPVEKDGVNILLVDGYAKKITLTISENPEENVICFFYSPQDEVSYTVYYLKDTGIRYDKGDVPPEEEILAPTKVKTLTNLESLIVSESSVEIDGYEVDAYKKFITLTTDVSNVTPTQNAVYFYYSPVERKGNYEVKFFFMDENGNYPETPDFVSSGEDSVGKYIKASDYPEYLPLTDPLYIGHEYDEEKSDVLMVVISSGETATMNLYFKNKTYTVTYDTVGGDWTDTSDIYVSNAQDIYTTSVSYNSVAPEPLNPTKDGYRFVAWYDKSTDELYDFSNKIKDDVELYARWIETKDITLTKNWDDFGDQDGKRPSSIAVYLKANEVIIDTLTITENDNWTKEIKGLDVYDLDGNIINYTIEEESIEGYDISYNLENNNYTITNTHTPEKRNITITKIWDDNSDQDGKRPESINVDIRVDGVLFKSIQLSEKNNWQEVLYDLDVYKNGVMIDYTVDEEETEGYTTTVEELENGFNVINKHEIEKTSLNVKKEWDDNNNQDGKRTDSVIVNLKANGKIISDATLSSANEWKYTWSDIDKYSNGELVNYEVEEVLIDGYTPNNVYDSITNTWTITNVHVPETKDINITKIWDDNNDQDGKRPTSIDVNLLLNGNVIDKITLSEENMWSGVFKDLTVYENGVELNYSISEVQVSDYDVSIVNNGNDYIITNTHEPEREDRIVKKIWRDGSNKDNTRPDSVTFRLLKNGEIYSDDITLTAANQVDNFDEWVYTFKDLDVYENGEKINYTVEEINIPDGYGVIYNQKKLYIYNAYPPELELSVEKIWNDENNADGIRPNSIGVQLYANGQPYQIDGNNIGYVELNEENDWQYTWGFAEKYDQDGNKYEYSLEEVYVGNDNYTSEISVNDNQNPEFQCTYIVKNTYVPQKTSRTINKIWDDNNDQDGMRPEGIKVHLFANGVEVSDATLSSNNGWTYTFDNINLNENGQEIEYTLTEDAVDGYSSSIVYDNNGTFNVTNTHVPEKRNITITKIWDDNNNQDGKIPNDITVNLMANDVNVKTLNITSQDLWTITVRDLPVYENGQKIEYTLKEENIEGYSTEYSTSENNYIITNTHEPEKRTIVINKEWNDDEDRDGIRPTNIYISLKADDVVVKDNIILNRTTNWQAEITDLDVYNNGNIINYTIEESEIEKYKTEYDYDLENNLVTVKNTHIPETKSITIKKLWNDEENLYNKRPDEILVDVLANGSIVRTVTLEEVSNWELTVGGLYVNESGKEIEYTLKEHESRYYTDTYENQEDSYTITNDIVTYNIKTNVMGIGGKISGDGLESYERVAYDDTNTKPIIITPDEGYKIEKIQINGVEQILPDEVTKEYTLPNIENITEDKNITVSFSRIEYKITTEVINGNGTISGENEEIYETILHGEDSIKEIVITPNYGYEILRLTINGVEQEIPENIAYPYTLDKFTNLTENMHVAVEYKRIEAQVVVSYVTTTGEKLIDDLIIDSYIGEKYITDSKENDFENYVLVTIPDNAQGIIDETIINVTYVFEHRPNLYVTKTVKGDYADINKEFNFSIQLMDNNGNLYTENVKYTVTDIENNIISEGELVTGQEDFKLLHGQKISFIEIPENMIYIVSEHDATDYVTTINGVVSKDKTTTGVLKDNINIDFVNEKEYIAPTGIMMSILPFGVGIIFVIVVWIIVKKSKKLERNK